MGLSDCPCSPSRGRPPSNPQQESPQSERFRCDKQIARYLGLLPSEESSGERRRLGHINKQGNTLLRFLLVEAAQVAVRSHPQWRSQFFSPGHVPQATNRQGRDGPETLDFVHSSDCVVTTPSPTRVRGGCYRLYGLLGNHCRHLVRIR